MFSKQNASWWILRTHSLLWPKQFGLNFYRHPLRFKMIFNVTESVRERASYYRELPTEKRHPSAHRLSQIF